MLPEPTEDVIDSPPLPLLFLLLLAIWLFGHPFQGLQHDAILYAVQALSLLHPERYSHDLFFLYGSQDEFTLFTPIYATLIDFSGLHNAMLILLVAGYLIWAGGAALLVGRLLQGFPFWFGLVLIFSIPGYYAMNTLFRYGEPFLTPRIFAEGLSLLALALLLDGKRIMPLALLLAALAIHPLMALAGVSFAGFYLLKENPKLLLAVAAVAFFIVLLLAFWQFAPFDRLLITMDSEWFEVTFPRSPFIFWDGWEPADLNRALFAFGLLLAASVTAHGRLRHAFLSALAILVTSFLLFWFGTSLTHNLLLIQLQPYRWLWLANFFSFIAAAWLTDRFWNKDRGFRLLLLGFLTAWLLPEHAGGGLAVVLCAMFILHTRSATKINISQTTAQLISWLPLAALAWRLLVLWQEAFLAFSLREDAAKNSFKFAIFWGINFFKEGGGAIIAVPWLLGIWRHGSVQRKVAHLITTGGVLLLLALSLAFWNRPDKWNRFYLHKILQKPIPTFSSLIPEEASVYWEEDLLMPWFVLNRSSYVSFHQIAGLAFNRQTAMEGKRRMDRLAVLGTKDSIINWLSKERLRPPGYITPPISIEALTHVCHDPALDFVVLSSNLGQGIIARHFEKVTGKYYYLYDCTELRHNFADTWEDKKAPQ